MEFQRLMIMNCHPGDAHSNSGVGHLPRTIYIYVTVWVCEDGDGESVSGEGVGM